MSLTPQLGYLHAQEGHKQGKHKVHVDASICTLLPAITESFLDCNYPCCLNNKNISSLRRKGNLLDC